MNQEYINSISYVLTSINNGTQAYSSFDNLTTDRIVQGLLGLGSVLEGIAATAGRGSPVLAASLGLADSLISINNIANQIAENGTAQSSDISSTLAGLTGALARVGRTRLRYAA